MGPVLGSLVVTEVSSHTLASHPNWRFQFYVCGIAGLVVFVLAFFGLRELSPRLRDQLMVSLRDRALVEARAAGMKPEELLQNQWRQMLRFDVVGGALSISLFLLLYYIAVAFIVVYFATVFGWSEKKANSLANWYWISNAIALVAAGLLSDKLRVRKPFMIIGAGISLVGVVLWALAATHPSTGYYQFAGYCILMAVGGGLAYCAWMASFTETVEKHNPAATATGLAVWGWILRIIVTASFAFFTLVIPATSTLVDQGPRAQAIQAAHPKEVKTLQALDPATSSALAQNATDPQALPKALGEVALSDGASQAKADQVQAAAARRIQQLTTASAIDSRDPGHAQQQPDGCRGDREGPERDRQGLQHQLRRGARPAAGAGATGGEGGPQPGDAVRHPAAERDRQDPRERPGVPAEVRRQDRGRPGEGTQAVAALVVGLRGRPGDLHSVRVRDDRPVEPAQGP